jgi:hypothetical protein
MKDKGEPRSDFKMRRSFNGAGFQFMGFAKTKAEAARLKSHMSKHHRVIKVKGGYRVYSGYR